MGYDVCSIDSVNMSHHPKPTSRKRECGPPGLTSAGHPGTVSLLCQVSERVSALNAWARGSASAHASSRFLRHRVRFQMGMPSHGSTRTPLAACRIVRTRQELFHREKACISSPDRRRSCTSLDAAEV